MILQICPNFPSSQVSQEDQHHPVGEKKILAPLKYNSHAQAISVAG